jgi:hypothetical protein
MAKKGETMSAAAATTAGAPTEEIDNFLPKVEGWVEIDSSGAAVYKPEVGLAEGKALMGIPYDVILALGGAAECKVWEAIVIRVLEPTVGTKGGEQVVVEAGEDILMPTNALLSDIARAALHPTRVRQVKLMPKGLVDHATKKSWQFWDFRIGLGPFVERAKENLYKFEERADIHEKLLAYEEGLKAGTSKRDDGSERVLAAFHQRLRMLAAEGKSAPALQQASA